VQVALIEHTQVNGRHVTIGRTIEDTPRVLFTVRDDAPEHAARILGSGRLITAAEKASETEVAGYSVTSGAKMWTRRVPYLAASLGWSSTGEVLLQRVGSPSELHRTFLDSETGQVLHSEPVDQRIVEQLEHERSDVDATGRQLAVAAPPHDVHFVVPQEAGFRVETADGVELWRASQHLWGKTWSLVTSTQVVDEIVLLHSYRRGASQTSYEFHHTVHAFEAGTGRFVGAFRKHEPASG
jgi:hypothetical protein